MSQPSQKIKHSNAADGQLLQLREHSRAILTNLRRHKLPAAAPLTARLIINPSQSWDVATYARSIDLPPLPIRLRTDEPKLPLPPNWQAKADQAFSQQCVASSKPSPPIFWQQAFHLLVDSLSKYSAQEAAELVQSCEDPDTHKVLAEAYYRLFVESNS